MQINTTKDGGEKLKLLKRERDSLVNAGALLFKIAKHADDVTARMAEDASDNLQGVLDALDGVVSEQAEQLVLSPKATKVLTESFVKQESGAK